MPARNEQPREFPRYELNAFVDYTGVEVLLHHRIQNISLGGICIQSPTVEEVGTVVDLVINFPGSNSSVSLQGVVVWSNNEVPMDMGIRYLDLDKDRKDTLRKFLAAAGKTKP